MPYQELRFPSRAVVWAPCPAMGEGLGEAHSPVVGSRRVGRAAAIVAQEVGRAAGRTGLASWMEEVRKEARTGRALTYAVISCHR